MPLKKLSFILLAILNLNIYSMQEQNNEKPGSEKSHAEISPAKSSKTKKLKFFCAQRVLKDKIPTDALPEELKNYLKHFDKLEEIQKHTLVPLFKAYLIRCFDYLSLGDLKTILEIVDKAYEVSEQKCVFMQRSLPITTRRVFSENPLLMTSLLVNQFPHEFSDSLTEIVEKKEQFYRNELADLKSDDHDIRNKLSERLAIIELIKLPNATLHSPALAVFADGAERGYASSLNKLGSILAVTVGAAHSLACLEELIKLQSIDFAAELIGFLLSGSYGQQLFSHKIEILQRRNFCNCLNAFINMVINESHYQSDYDIALALIYNYLDDKDQAKKYAKKCLKANEGLASKLLFRLLKDIYEHAGKVDKAEFYSSKIKEIEDIA